SEAEKVHVRRRVQEPQAAIDLERIEVRSAAEARGQDDLVDVSRGDIPLRFLDGVDVPVARQARARVRESARPRRCVDAAAQRGDDLGAKPLPLVVAARMEERDSPRQVIENEERRRGDEDRLGNDRKSTRLNSSHVKISYAVFCLKKKKNK